MPKNPVTDPITDQEMAFAHLILSGTMNDRRAVEPVGLKPDTAAYTKSKPRVRAYTIEHRAAVREKVVDQEAAPMRAAAAVDKKPNFIEFYKTCFHSPGPFGVLPYLTGIFVGDCIWSGSQARPIRSPIP
jgi:hypothetical protein